MITTIRRRTQDLVRRQRCPLSTAKTNREAAHSPASVSIRAICLLFSLFRGSSPAFIASWDMCRDSRLALSGQMRGFAALFTG